MEKRRALGRGLEALIPDVEPIIAQEEATAGSVAYVDVNEITPNKYQPRENFNQEKLDELVASIKEKGVIQPLLVRRSEAGFELIAGERRLRAMKTLGMEKAPVILKEVDDVGAMELALIENIQREELNAMEEAHSYKRLMDEFEFTQEKIAQTIGKDRSSIANTLRLLNLPLEIQRHVVNNKISAGHARAILSINGLQQQLNLCKKIIKKGLSVRETELLATPGAKKRAQTETIQDQHILVQEEKLQHALATKVRIKHKKKRGKITIEYYSMEDLSRIIDKITSA